MGEIEIWKDIPDYPNYQVSNWGRVKSLKGKEKILKPRKNKNGYLYVNLCKDGKQKNFTIHKLVALAFIPNDNPIEKTEINHLNENKENNNVSNLCWCTRKENNNYGTHNERVSKTLKGKFKDKENHPFYGKHHTKETKQKLSIPIIQLDLQNNFICEWQSATTASKELNIYQSNITACCRGKRKSAYGYIWRYKE